MNSDDDIQTIAEALVRLQWRRGPGGPRGFGPPHSGQQKHGGPGRGEFPFGGRHRPEGPWGGRDHGRDSAGSDGDAESGRRFGDDPSAGAGAGDRFDEWRERFKSHLGGRAQLRLLIALVQAGRALGVSAIGDAIGVDQPRASRLVSQGVELGLLQREADPDDARRTLIALTDKGKAITNRFRGAQRASVDQAVAGFTEDERALLANLLSRLADAWPK